MTYDLNSQHLEQYLFNMQIDNFNIKNNNKNNDYYSNEWSLPGSFSQLLVMHRYKFENSLIKKNQTYSITTGRKFRNFDSMI